MRRRMLQCRRVVTVTRGGGSTSTELLQCARDLWQALRVGESTQGSTPETHRVPSDAPAEAPSDRTGSRRHPNVRWRAIP